MWYTKHRKTRAKIIEKEITEDKMMYNVMGRLALNNFWNSTVKVSLV